MKSAIVFGAGSWGTALASLLDESGLSVQFWGRDSELMREIADTRRNTRYLPHLQLSPGIRVSSDLNSLEPADLLVFVVPSKGVRDTSQAVAAAGLGASAKAFLSCAKGIAACRDGVGYRVRY